MCLNHPIGLFDSGVGGTSIWKELHQLLPLEDTIYLADSKYAPYGIRSKEEIIHLCEKNTEFLLNEKCKIIVVACNTATTNAIQHLRAKYNVPFIGIEPAIKPASLNTSTKSVGILATRGTLASSLFQETSSLYAKGIHLIEQEGTGIVELIEDGKLYSKEMEELLMNYLQPIIDKNIDYLVLGCSHYPYLIPILKKIVPSGITIIDSGRAVAKQTASILKKKGCLRKDNANQQSIFYTNGSTQVISELIGSNYSIKQVLF